MRVLGSTWYISGAKKMVARMSSLEWMARFLRSREGIRRLPQHVRGERGGIVVVFHSCN